VAVNTGSIVVVVVVAVAWMSLNGAVCCAVCAVNSAVDSVFFVSSAVRVSEFIQSL